MPPSRNLVAVVGQERDPIVAAADNTTLDETESTPLVEERWDRKNSWKGYEDFEGLPWWKSPSAFWLMGPFFLFTLAFGGVIVPKLNLILDLICRKRFAEQALVDPNFTYAPIILGTDNPQCFIPEIKKSVSMFTMATNLCTGILSALTAPKIGQLSDRYGRVKFLALASCGGCLSELITILCAKYSETFHYNWLIVGAVMDGMTGSFTTGTILTNSYTSDCTPPSKRSVYIGYIHACLFTGLAFGPLLASFLVSLTGSMLSIFYITLGCHIFFVLFVGIVVPESLSEKRQVKAQEKYAQEQGSITESSIAWWSSLRTGNLLAPLKVLWPKGAGTTPPLRRNLLAFAIIDMILLGSSVSAGPVILLYCESADTWDWGTVESSRFISAVSMVRVVVLIIILPIINYIFRLRPKNKRQVQETGMPPVPIKDANAGADKLDLWLMRIALTSDVIGSIGYVLARHEAVFVFSGMLTALGGLGSATIQSAVTKHVPAEQVGQLLGAIGLLHAFARVLGPIAFNSLYYATVGKFDQAIFVLLASLFGVSLLASLAIRPFVHLQEPEERSGEQEPLLQSSRPHED